MRIPSFLSQSVALSLLLTIFALPTRHIVACESSLVPDSAAVNARKIPPEVIAQLAVTKAQNQFAAKLWGQIREKKGNLAISPHAIAGALTMTMAGTTGATHKELSTVLGYDKLDKDQIHTGRLRMESALQPNEDKPIFELLIANSLWLQNGWTIEPDFKFTLDVVYSGHLYQEDFARNNKAHERINAWVKEKTNKRIDGLLPELNPLTRLVVVNAAWLEAQWDHPFQEEQTKELDFHGEESVIKAQFMHDESRGQFATIPDGIIAMRGCSRKRNSLSFFVIVPNSLDGLKALEDKISVGSLQEWVDSCKRQQVKWILPRLQLQQESSLDLIPPLKRLGLSAAFTPSLDFSLLAKPQAGEDPKLMIGQMSHKVFLSINEKGIEAAAATSVSLSKEEKPNVTAEARCDRPFLWGIWNNHYNSLLFLGRVTDPTKGL